MRTEQLLLSLVLGTSITVAFAQTAAPAHQARPQSAVAVPANEGPAPQGAHEVLNIGGVPFGEGSGIYDPYEHRVLGRQRWEKDSFLRFLYHTPGTRHELPVVYGPLKEGC